MRQVTPCCCLLLTTWVRLAYANGSVNQVIQFLSDNGHRYVDIFYDLSSMKWYTTFRPRDIFFSRSSFTMAEGKSYEFSVFLYETKMDNMEDLLKIIGQTNVKESLLILDEPKDDMSDLQGLVEEMKLNAFFYLAIPEVDGGIMAWYQVISLASGCVIDRISFFPNTLFVSDKFNLNGLEVTSTSLSWPPFYSMEDCNEEGCAISNGYLKDYIDILARRFNFTHVSYKDMDNDWGVFPKEGPFNLSGTWGGVMGDVVNNKFDMSVSAWWWTSDRSTVLDCVAVTKERGFLVLTPQQPTDTSLFTRCFTNYSWIAISCTIGIVLCCTLLHNSIIPDKHANSEMIFSFTVWLFFVLLNAFYGGALTMFFTGTTNIDFNSRKDVFREYPDWKFKLTDGSEMNIYHEVLQGDADHVAFWERYLEDKSAYTYKTIKEGLEFIAEGQNVIDASEQRLFNYLKNNPTDQQLYFFGHNSWRIKGIIFPLNSPLAPIFKQGAGYVRERGMEKQLELKWIGNWKASDESLMDTTVLTAGQTMMIFVTLMGTLGLTLMLLCGELIFMKIYKKWKKHLGSHAK